MTRGWGSRVWTWHEAADTRIFTPRPEAMPEADFAWSLTANWGGFGGLVAKKWDERERSTEQMYGEVFGKVSQIPGLRVFPRLDPPLPTRHLVDICRADDHRPTLAGRRLHRRRR